MMLSACKCMVLVFDSTTRNVNFALYISVLCIYLITIACIIFEVKLQCKGIGRKREEINAVHWYMLPNSDYFCKS